MVKTVFYTLPFEGSKYRKGYVLWSGKKDKWPWKGGYRKPGGLFYAVTRPVW